MFFQDRDPYAILGVHPGAAQQAIKAAYRALARRYHPDLATSAEARSRMIEINRAWEILGDPTKRAHHDRRPRNTPANEGATSTGRESDPGWMGRHAPDRRPTTGWGAGAKGPPPGKPTGSVLDFGIYLGWSLGEIARVDPLYLDWLADRPEGRRHRDEIAALRGRASAFGAPPAKRRWSYG